MIICVVGARPNFMKIAPIMRAFKEGPNPIEACLVHTGQHYDEAMKDTFFRQLDIPEPDIDLGVGSGSHAVQTAEVMKKFEPVVDEKQPQAVLVVGDVNSTIACGLVAAKKGIPVIHVEAGLRSYDREMPEEINRILTDQLSDILFTTERSALGNLEREGIDAKRVHFVGNVMIDTLKHNVERAVPIAETFTQYDIPVSIADSYALVTMHRPSNVDVPDVLKSLLTCLADISEQTPIVFPIHPRTKSRVEQFGLSELINRPNIHLLPPQGYLQLLGLMSNAKLVLTDSGGIQEETTALGVPCITMRENTERPITVSEGTNTVVGTDAGKIKQTYTDVMTSGGKSGCVPEYWDGAAAVRIKDILNEWLQSR